jgi:predicted PurR-regulated permease PerM
VTSGTVTETHFRQAFLVLLVVAISAAFVAMIRAFLLTILLAAIFSGLSYPAYRWLLERFRGREAPAAIATLVLLLVLVIAPVLAVLGASANEALRVTETVRPRLEQLVEEPGELHRRLRALPGYDYVEPYRAQVLITAGELVGRTSLFLFGALSAVTRATAVFVFHFFVLLYTMYYFLTGGPGLLRAVLAYLPLTEADKQRMLGKFVSVTRATLKGTILIGVIQGVLGGLAFWAVGLDGAIFWGTVMTVLSIIPGVGSALVWVPAAIILMATGALWRGIALAVFCAVVVGSVATTCCGRGWSAGTPGCTRCSSSSPPWAASCSSVWRASSWAPSWRRSSSPRGRCSARRSAARSPNPEPRRPTLTIVRQPDATSTTAQTPGNRSCILQIGTPGHVDVVRRGRRNRDRKAASWMSGWPLVS